MKILFCSAEVAPFAKVGGLADVAGSLPKALADLGHDVTVCMPAYGMVVDDPRWQIKLLRDDIFVRVNAFTLVKSKVYEGRLAENVRLCLIDGEERFAKVKKSEDVYSPVRDDYIFFSQAAMEFCQDTKWMPDVIHAHDWHMGLLPVMLRETRHGAWDHVATAFTIHNLAYQGEFGFDTLDAAGLPHELFNMHKMEAYNMINFLKSGCVFADQVNTVSQNYAKEITTPEYGCGLDGLMRHLDWTHRLRGILNGIDVDVHDPATDAELPAHFDAENLAGKAECRIALGKELGLELSEDTPVIGVVSRLSNQKGFDLILAAADRILATGARLVVLGTGDPWAAGELRRLQQEKPGQVAFIEAFDAPLAQRIYGGCDMFLMPSAFEPCGLGQMFAMRYGTVPIVRHTGGLADTVFEGLNGFDFPDKSADQLAAAVERATERFRDKDAWLNLVRAGMTADFSWSKSARAYIEMYETATRNRHAALAVARAAN